MAGWSSIPQSAGDTWASASGAWAELFAAWNERRAVLKQSAVTAPAAGDVIADKDLIQDIQSWIESNADEFVATIDSGGSTRTDFNDETEIEMWSWTKLQARISGLSSGWTRKNGSGTSNAQHAAGYYASFIDLMNDLRLVLNELRWTRYQLSWERGSGALQRGSDTDGSSPFDSWATLRGNAETAYAADTPSSSSDGPPYSEARLTRDDTGVGRKANMVTVRARVTPDFNIDMTTSMDLYLYPVATSGLLTQPADINTFDPLEQPRTSGYAIVEDCWNLVDTQTASALNEITSALIGEHTQPTWPADPTVDQQENSSGWESDSPMGSDVTYVVLRWDVSGGFTYY